MQGVHMHTSAGKLKGLVSTAPLMQTLNISGEPWKAGWCEWWCPSVKMRNWFEGEVNIKNTITAAHWERALLNLKYSIRKTGMTSPSGRCHFKRAGAQQSAECVERGHCFQAHWNPIVWADSMALKGITCAELELEAAGAVLPLYPSIKQHFLPLSLFVFAALSLN